MDDRCSSSSAQRKMAVVPCPHCQYERWLLLLVRWRHGVCRSYLSNFGKVTRRGGWPGETGPRACSPVLCLFREKVPPCLKAIAKVIFTATPNYAIHPRPSSDLGWISQSVLRTRLFRPGSFCRFFGAQQGTALPPAKTMDKSAPGVNCTTPSPQKVLKFQLRAPLELAQKQPRHWGHSSMRVGATAGIHLCFPSDVHPPSKHGSVVAEKTDDRFWVPE